MEAVLLGVHVFVAIALIGIVLIQRSSQDGFGMGSGSGAGFMTGRQSANLLTRVTGILAAVFMLNSLVLTVLAANRSEISIVDRIEAAQEIAPTQSVEDAASDAFSDEEVIPDAPNGVIDNDVEAAPAETGADEVIPEAPLE